MLYLTREPSVSRVLRNFKTLRGGHWFSGKFLEILKDLQSEGKLRLFNITEICYTLLGNLMSLESLEILRRYEVVISFLGKFLGNLEGPSMRRETEAIKYY